MKTIKKVSVVGVEKRRHPSKHYVYVIHVSWSEGGQYVIYRRYSRFFDLQSTLLNKFPIEAGTMEPSQRIIPILPGKILFGRSHIREVAIKRLKPIDEYCQLLIDLPEQISQCEDVLSFFEVEDEDLEPPTAEEYDQKVLSKVNKISKPKQLQQYVAVADYTKQEIGEIDLHAGMVMEVMEQSESGWWFVSTENQQGWVPSTFLQSDGGITKDSTTRAKPGEELKYICIEPFETEREDELCLDRGSVVEVVEKNLVGWWFVRHQSSEGWVPATYLCKIKSSDQVGEVAVKGSLSDISKQNEDRSLANSWKGEDTTEEKSLGLKHCILSKVNNTRSSKKGGSLRPPPRQDSFENKTIMVCDINIHQKTDNYITVTDFKDSVGDGISFSAGRIVTVHEKAAGGWWYVEIDGHSGWAPSSYIEKSSVKIHSDCADNPSSNDSFVQSSSSKSETSEIVTKECDNIYFGRKKPNPTPKGQACLKPPLLPKQTSKSSNIVCLKQDGEAIVKKMVLPGATHMTENLKTRESGKAMIHSELKIKPTAFDGEENDDFTIKQTHVHSAATVVKRRLDKETKDVFCKESAASRFGKKPPITRVQKPDIRPKPTHVAYHCSLKVIKPANSLESKNNVSQVLQSAVVNPSVSQIEEVKESDC